MRYALVRNNLVEQIGLPQKWYSGTRWWDFRNGVGDNTDWLPIVETDKPADTPTTLYTESVQLVNSVPTVVWVVRNKTQEEITNETYSQNKTQLSSNPEDQIDAILASVDAINLILGSDGDVAGTTTLRAMKKMSNANILTGQVLKDLIQHIINLAQEQKKSNRGVATLERLEYDVLDSTNVGAP